MYLRYVPIRIMVYLLLSPPHLFTDYMKIHTLDYYAHSHRFTREYTLTGYLYIANAEFTARESETGTIACRYLIMLYTHLFIHFNKHELSCMHSIIPTGCPKIHRPLNF